ncbi:hypothetical protein [Nonomuraea sp. NPDC003804]|uniref:hypothetical protein n=1 Tax=Nonomuraea sp. NPDC003804 TaxID=3154547 RepID=UPI0033AA8B83
MRRLVGPGFSSVLGSFPVRPVRQAGPRATLGAWPGPVQGYAPRARVAGVRYGMTARQAATAARRQQVTRTATAVLAQRDCEGGVGDLDRDRPRRLGAQVAAAPLLLAGLL